MEKYTIKVEQHEEEGCTIVEIDNERLANEFKSLAPARYGFIEINRTEELVILSSDFIIATDTIRRFVNSTFNPKTVEVI